MAQQLLVTSQTFYFNKKNVKSLGNKKGDVGLAAENHYVTIRQAMITHIFWKYPPKILKLNLKSPKNP